MRELVRRVGVTFVALSFVLSPLPLRVFAGGDDEAHALSLLRNGCGTPIAQATAAPVAVVQATTAPAPVAPVAPAASAAPAASKTRVVLKLPLPASALAASRYHPDLSDRGPSSASSSEQGASTDQVASTDRAASTNQAA